MKFKEDILNKLPNNWNEINLKQYIKIAKIDLLTVSDEYDLLSHLDNIVSIASILLDVNKTIIENLTYEEIQLIANKLEYFNSNPNINYNCKIKIKKIDKISYNSFILFQQLSKNNLIDNYPSIIKEFIKDKLTVEEIELLSIEDCMYLFDSVKKKLKLFLTIFQIKIVLKIIKMNLKKSFKIIVSKLKFWSKKKK